MNVLITGGAGFIGTYIQNMFLKDNHNIFVVDNLSTGDKKNIANNDTFFEGDIIDEKIYQKLKSQQIDTIVHLAAQTSVPHSLTEPLNDMRINIEGTLKLLEFAKQNNVKRIIFASSAAVYGNNENIPIKEDQYLLPNSPYGISKMAAEHYIKTICEESKIDYVILRFSNVFGPKQSKDGEGGVIKVFIEHLLHNKQPQIFGDGSQTRDFIYVEDIAEAHLSALKVKSGIYNLSTKREVSIQTLYDTITEIMDKKSVVPLYSKEREGDIYKSCLNNEKFQHLTGWLPRFSIEDGLKLTIGKLNE